MTHMVQPSFQQPSMPSHLLARQPSVPGLTSQQPVISKNLPATATLSVGNTTVVSVAGRNVTL